MRYSMVRCGCDVRSPSNEAECDKHSSISDLEKRSKSRAPVHETAVARYVRLRSPALTKKVSKVLSKSGKHTAKLLADGLRSLAESPKKAVAKADDTDQGKPPPEIAAPAADVLMTELNRIAASIDFGAVASDVTDSILDSQKDAYVRAYSKGTIQVGLPALDEAALAQLDEAALYWAKSRGAQLVTEIEETTRTDLRSLIERAVKEGWSTGDLSDAVIESAGFSESRAETIARTELAFAHVQGNVDGWAESGEVEGKQSILGDNHDEPDECDQAVEAGVVPLDQEFLPGLMQPPYHPRCVCDILPILKPE